MLKTLNDYEKEIKRVEIALTKTTSQKLINDYTKYRAKLLKEVRDYKRYKGIN